MHLWGDCNMNRDTTASLIWFLVGFFLKKKAFCSKLLRLSMRVSDLSHCISPQKKLISIFTHINCFISLKGSNPQFSPIMANLVSCCLNSIANSCKA